MIGQVGTIGTLEVLKKMLFDAVHRNDTEEAIRILDSGIDINTQNNFGQTPIFLAALYNNLQMVKKLAELGADLEVRDKHGDTVLSRMVSQGKYKYEPYKRIPDIDRLLIIESLIEKGADLAANIRNCCSPIHIAIQTKCSLDIVKVLTIRDTINKQDIFGFAPLHLAVLHNRTDIVEFLIEHENIDIDLKCNKTTGDTPLMLASRFEFLEIMKLLLDKNANLEQKNSRSQTFFSIVHLKSETPIKNIIKSLSLKVDPKNELYLYKYNKSIDDIYFTHKTSYLCGSIDSLTYRHICAVRNCLHRFEHNLFSNHVSEYKNLLTNPYRYIFSNSVPRHRTHPYLRPPRASTAELTLDNRYIPSPRLAISAPPRPCSTIFSGPNTPESSISEVSTNLDRLNVSTASEYYLPATTDPSELVSSFESNNSEPPQYRGINLPRTSTSEALQCIMSGMGSYYITDTLSEYDSLTTTPNSNEAVGSAWNMFESPQYEEDTSPDSSLSQVSGSSVDSFSPSGSHAVDTKRRKLNHMSR